MENRSFTHGAGMREPLLNSSTSSEELNSYTDEGKVFEEGEIYEAAVSSVGFGRYNILLLFVCGWAVASDSVEIQCVSFVLPSACDLHLDSNQKGWLNAVIFIGMMFGGYCFGGVSDIKGRRSVLIWSLTVNGLFGVGSSFANSFWLFLSLRFMSGVGVGAAMPVSFSYFVEFLPKVKRGPFVSLLACFWTLGNIITAGIAWFVLPKVGIGGDIGDLHYGSWRIFVALCAIPSLSSALFFFLLPESPKFLQKVGKFDEATSVLVTLFRGNNLSKSIPLPDEISNFSYYCMRSTLNTESQRQLTSPVASLFTRLKIITKRILVSSKEVFSGAYRLRSFIMVTIFLTFSFSYYGLWMWFPELFQRIASGDSSCGNIHVDNTTFVKHNWTCTEKLMNDNTIYFQTFLVAAATIPGNIATILFVNIIGRKYMLAGSLLLAGVSVFFFWFVKSYDQMIAMSCVFSGVANIGWNVLDVLSMEMYPTHLRSTAFGIQSAVGRIASIVANVTFGKLVDVHCSIPLLMVVAFLAVGGLSALKLPKTEHEPLH